MNFRNNMFLHKIIIFPLFIFTEAFWIIKGGKSGQGFFHPNISPIPTSAILIPRIPENFIGKTPFYNKKPNILLSYNPKYYFLVLNNPNGYPNGYPNDYLEKETHLPIDYLTPRFFKPFSIFGGKRPRSDSKEKKGQILNRTCNTLGGTVVDGECYEYIPDVLPFEEAQARCALKNGHLFTPNFNDLEYFDKLRLAMMEFLNAPRNEIWVGARIAASGVATDVNGVDVTNTQQFKLDFTYFDFDDPQDGCAILNFDFGSPIIDNPPCESPYSFICEYRIDADSIMQQEAAAAAEQENNNRISIVFDKDPFFFLKKFYG
ncbi:UNVERIFIED_CONTAM: hypothetical protein RMT77_013664 [Armadillidium vulgare]